MKPVLRSLVASIALLGSLTAVAGGPGDPEAGKSKSQTCAACHAADGNSENPIYPIIAGQYRDYLVQALKDYQAGARNNPIMKGMVAALSETDILDLAAYFSRQSSILATPKPQ